MSQSKFSSLDLKPEVLSNLDSLGYQQMTPIQEKSLPSVVAGCDVIAQGKTGSGKTAAFGLGLLHRLNAKKFHVQALVLCPTRELADQVAVELRRLARATQNVKILVLCGGAPFGPQIASLEHGAHIVVGTPGRVEEHLRKGSLELGKLETLVLDEADRMLDMGFQDAIDDIAEYLPGKRQTLLFSATFPAEIQAISERIMHKPVMVQVASKHDDNSIEQHFYKVADSEQRLLAVRLLLSQFQPESAVVFCNTKQITQEVTDELTDCGFSAMCLNGDLEQRERDQALIQFANKSVAVLVATDVAARGLDIDDLGMVINFHIAHDEEVHIHRIGRTGRAGHRGMACSLISQKESFKVERLAKYLDIDIDPEALPAMQALNNIPPPAAMGTIRIDGGKKQKLRPGDILGALTSKDGLAIKGHQIGKINIADNWSYVAVQRDIVKQAANKISNGKLKGRSFRAWRVKL